MERVDIKGSTLYIVGTPIGNLGDITLRALEVLKAVDVIFCEDTRRTAKLLNAFEIKTKLKSAPYFKERSAGQKVIDLLQQDKAVAFVSDAGMPAVSDPGSILVESAQKEGFRVEIISGVSSLTHFIAGLGRELESFEFIGFLPAKSTQKKKLFENLGRRPLIFFESPHRIQKTLKLIADNHPQLDLSLGKELSKLSEAFFHGSAADLLEQVPSWKGEWVGLVWPHVNA